MNKWRILLLAAGFVLLAIGGWMGWVAALEAASKSESLSATAVFVIFALGMPAVAAVYTYAVLSIRSSGTT